MFIVSFNAANEKNGLVLLTDAKYEQPKKINPYIKNILDEDNLGDQALLVCNSMPVYARVDIIEDNNGDPAVSELELIEPELWFRHKPVAAMSFADAVINYIDTLYAVRVLSLHQSCTQYHHPLKTVWQHFVCSETG